MKNILSAILIIIGILAGSVGGYTVATSNTALQSTTTTTVFLSSAITTSTSISCSYSTYPEALVCPTFLSQTWNVSVDYNGPWGLSYQGYLGSGTSGSPIESGSFFGHGPTNESITVSAVGSGITACVEAQKLDNSNSVLVLNLLTGNAHNSTSLPFGTVKLCMAKEIV
ncbi:MAG: hypothetical protein JRN20_13935 [Nitrososphaerota archaeon]|nr:hypothetical protein [Nitrososphaerota archaeon]MDG6922727.1 hypothetical protein [Nitrososphaerota archaeon]